MSKMLPLEAVARVGDVVFVDVREADEFEAGHVEGSLHIPIGQVEQRWRELAVRGPVVVVCQIGQRSGLVTNFLRANGVDAHNLEGGLEAWSSAGFALSSPNAHPQVVDGWARDLSGKRLHP